MPDHTTVDDTSAPLARAAALEGAGQFREAIDQLERSAARAPDGLVEAELVGLRHRARVAVPRLDPTSLPPPVTAHPDPGPLAELRPADLNVDTLRSGLARHGCVLVRGLVSPDRADELAGGIDRALDQFDAEDDAESPPRGAPCWYRHFTPDSGSYRVGGRRGWVRATGALWTADSPHMFRELIATLDETGIGRLVTDYLGERPMLSANKCTLRRVPVDTNTAWHQDGAFLGENVRTLNLWLGLSSCGIDAPGLDLVPRRFDRLVESGTDGAYFDWAVGDDVVASHARDAPVVRPVFEPGDALLFDHLFLHRTAVTPTMTRPRHAMETWFFAPSTYPHGQIPLVY